MENLEVLSTDRRTDRPIDRHTHTHSEECRRCSSAVYIWNIEIAWKIEYFWNCAFDELEAQLGLIKLWSLWKLDAPWAAICERSNVQESSMDLMEICNMVQMPRYARYACDLGHNLSFPSEDQWNDAVGLGFLHSNGVSTRQAIQHLCSLLCMDLLTKRGSSEPSSDGSYFRIQGQVDDGTTVLNLPHA